MDIEILHRPSYAMAKVKLAPSETIQAETGAMLGMSESIEIQTESKGGLLKGLKRAVLGGESFFINTYTAPSGGDMMLAPALPGDVQHHQISGANLFVQSGSYMASSSGINVDTKWGGAKTFFSGEGLFLLHVTGTGDLLVSSYGAIHEIELGAGEKFRIDTSHIVAFEEGVNYEVKKVGGWKSTILSGEGLVCELTGPGKVALQTRSQGAFLNWLIPLLPKQTSSS
jgi:uncharacterized protein (TIGR00266 family)